MKKLVLCLLFSLLVLPHFGQNNVNDQSNINLAYSYYQNKEYDKAAPMFFDLYEKSKSTHYFDYYINCLIALKQYDEAEKAMKKVMRSDRNPMHSITLGYIYKSKNDLKASQKIFDDVVEGLAANSGSVISIANTFFNRGEFEYAEKTYLKGRQLIPGEMFRTYLATVYAYKRDYESMMQEYLAMLSENESNLANVQGRLSSLMRFDFDNTLRNLVRKEVIRKIQTNPESLVFNRLLIWIYVQEENYSQALNQSISLDKRTRKEEEGILTLARNLANNSLFDIALSGIDYLLQRKPDASNLAEVRQEKVNTGFLKLISSPRQDEASQKDMEIMFQSFFTEFGYNTRTAPLARNYAHFMAFYRHQSEAAFEVIDAAMKSKEMDANQYTLLKIELADLNVYAGYLWEASLQYAQIVDANKNNPMGDEVKLKKAKLSFYQGEIEWAKAQLDVLKASTSKLIANDAMELSLLITGTYELDTIVEPIILFASADLELFRNQYEKAYLLLDSLEKQYPGHALGEFILMRKARIYELQFNFEKAAEIYSKIVDEFSYSVSADDALYHLAQITELQLNDTEKAKTYYQRILVDFPGSIYVADARQKFREIRGDFPNNDPFDLLQKDSRTLFTE